jgi:hypothetical protein
MNKTKTAVVFLIILTVVAVTGFTLVLTRKQEVTESGQVKSFWKKPKSTDTKEA